MHENKEAVASTQLNPVLPIARQKNSCNISKYISNLNFSWYFKILCISLMISHGTLSDILWECGWQTMASRDEENHKQSSLDSWSLGQKLNPSPSEYKRGMLPTWTQYSFFENMVKQWTRYMPIVKIYIIMYHIWNLKTDLSIHSHGDIFSKLRNYKSKLLSLLSCLHCCDLIMYNNKILSSNF
jgi:hypothetical protein